MASLPLQGAKNGTGGEGVEKLCRKGADLWTFLVVSFFLWGGGGSSCFLLCLFFVRETTQLQPVLPIVVVFFQLFVGRVPIPLMSTNRRRMPFFPTLLHPRKKRPGAAVKGSWLEIDAVLTSSRQASSTSLCQGGKIKAGEVSGP